MSTFPPAARHHYDLDSPFTVLSTIENYRRRNGPDGKDAVAEFSKAKWERYARAGAGLHGALDGLLAPVHARAWTTSRSMTTASP